MTRRVQVLPDGVANQIAAGEVVERPASVVKELVENALDAGSRRVEILLEGGGKRRIRVADDGTGMPREDALLSLDRHATSKIRTAEDLTGVRTFGFRGEALPSIAAVARMSLETRDEGDEVGTAIRLEGGRIVAVDDLPRRRGTTVDVRTLFHNAPARAKFLRSAAAETRAVSDLLTSLALATPGVAFHLESDGRVLLDLPVAPDLGTRVAALWGDEAADALIPLGGGGGELGLQGLIQRPDATRPGFRRAHLFLRGRPFREGALLRAADRGYRTTIAEGHRPWLLLYLHAPDGSVDVNVHPAKAEVRFRDLPAVEALVEASVRRALQGEGSAAPLDPSLARARPAPRSHPSVGEAAKPLAGALQTSLFVPGGAPLPGDGGHEVVTIPAPPSSADGTPEGEPGLPTEPSLPHLQGEAPRLWQVLDRYIIAETRDGLLLVDQHAAHERILFERILRAFDGEGIEAQQLLFPMTLRLTPAEYDAVTSMKQLFARVGFEVEGFGGNVVAVHAVPNPHPHFQAERALREMIAELAHGSPELRSARNQVERMAMSFACRAAIKAGQPLAEREVLELFDALFATELPFHDVHGRPTTVRLTRAELERTFGR